AGAGFGQSPRRELIAFCERREVLLFLGFIAGNKNMTAPERVVGRNGQGYGGVYSLEFLHDDCGFDVTKTGAAALFRHQDAHNSQFGEFRPQLYGKVLSFIPLDSVRPELSLGELTDGALNL